MCVLLVGSTKASAPYLGPVGHIDYFSFAFLYLCGCGMDSVALLFLRWPPVEIGCDWGVGSGSGNGRDCACTS